ncbi:MAG: recombinase family protein [Rhizobiaceae bacterium]
MDKRDELNKLLRDVGAGKCKVILAEGLDRITRDLEHAAAIHKRLTFRGAKIVTIAEGEITQMHVAFKGAMNNQFLADLAIKVVRGQRGRVEEGKVGGGLCYGFDVIRRFDDKGKSVNGERSINDAQARVIRRIFEMYVAGASPKAIAARLNAEGVPGPRGKGWSQSTINGNWQRGSGILNNEMYDGVITYNKVHYATNPDTGKHVARPNPEADWVRKEVPTLRIVDHELWLKAKARQRRGRNQRKEFWEYQRVRYLFSGLLRCGKCGGGYVKVSATHYGCSAVRNKGSAICHNRRLIAQVDLEATVLSVLQKNLMQPELVEVFCKEYASHLNRLRIDHNATMVGYHSELERLQQEENRLFQAVAAGYANSAGARRSNEIEARRVQLQELLATKKEAPTLIHPTMARRYKQEVDRLLESLTVEEHRQEAVELIRSLVDKVVLTPDAASYQGLVIDVYGDLAGILNVATGKAYTKDEAELKRVRMVLGLDSQRPSMIDMETPMVANGETQPLPRNGVSWCPGRESNLTKTFLSKLVGPEGLEPPTKRL